MTDDHLEPPPRLRGHPLRDVAGRHREDHHQPARGAQRVPAADRRRDDPRVRRGARRRRRSASSILTGAGDDAFCSGGDQRVRGDGGYVGDDGVPRLNVLDLQQRIRYLPKPVVAMVAGYAIGGGHVLHLVCDLTIAADNARFGQTGPRVGSFDGGFGASYLARIVGQKKAREIWFLCRQYDAQQALDMGLVNTVVPLAELEARRCSGAARCSQHVADRAALPQGRDQRRLRRPGRPAGARRQRDAALLHDRGGPRGQGSVPREAQARLLEVPAAARDREDALDRWPRGPRTLPAAVVPVVVGTACARARRRRRAAARRSPRSPARSRSRSAPTSRTTCSTPRRAPTARIASARRARSAPG